MPTPINISASRGASILGLSKWKTPVQTWLEIMEAREPGFCAKNKYELPEFEETPQLRWGKAFESAIIELAAKKQKSQIINREKFYERSLSGKKRKNGIITCHIDGCHVWTSDSEKYKNLYTLHEGKTTSYFYFHDNFGEPGTDRVPVEYQIQCQHQMICTGAEKVILSVLVFPRRVEEWEDCISDTPDYWKPEFDESLNEWFLEPQHTGASMDLIGNIMHEPIKPIEWAKVLYQMGYFHQYEIKSHPELQKRIVAHYTEFWNNHILKGLPPIPQSYDDIKALCTEPIGTILADENIERLMSEYHNIKSEIGETGPLAKRAEMIKIQVLNYMRNAGAVEDDESREKWILRDQQGNKLAQYGRDKNGRMGFR